MHEYAFDLNEIHPHLPTCSFAHRPQNPFRPFHNPLRPRSLHITRLSFAASLRLQSLLMTTLCHQSFAGRAERLDGLTHYMPR